MKPVINGRFYHRPVTGVERYSLELSRRLGKRARMISTPKNYTGLRGSLWEQVHLPGSIEPGELLWSPANTGPLSIAYQVLTIHDISPLEHPEWYQPGFALWYRFLMPRLVHRVRFLVVPSRYTRDRLIRFFSVSPAKITIVPGGVDHDRFKPGAASAPQRIPERYILYVGSLQPRKNIGALLNAWDLIKEELPGVFLVIAGMPGRAFRRSVLPQVRERVVFSGYVPDDQLPGIYANASLLVVPSFDEGFGLPALEAMSCGIPVIASCAGSLPEVIGSAGLFFESDDIFELGRHMRRLLTDHSFSAHLGMQGRLRAREFSWDVSTETLWRTLVNVS